MGPVGVGGGGFDSNGHLIICQTGVYFYRASM